MRRAFALDPIRARESRARAIAPRQSGERRSTPSISDARAGANAHRIARARATARRAVAGRATTRARRAIATARDARLNPKSRVTVCPHKATAVGRGQSAKRAGRSNAGRERRERRRGGEARVAHVAIGRRHPAEEDSDSTHVRREGDRKREATRGDARISRTRLRSRRRARTRARAKGRLTTAWTRERCADCECLNKGNRN